MDKDETASRSHCDWIKKQIAGFERISSEEAGRSRSMRKECNSLPIGTDVRKDCDSGYRKQVAISKDLSSIHGMYVKMFKDNCT